MIAPQRDREIHSAADDRGTKNALCPASAFTNVWTEDRQGDQIPCPSPPGFGAQAECDTEL